MTFLSSCVQLVQMARLARTANRGANAPTTRRATIKLESAHAVMAGLGRHVKHVCPSGSLSFSAQNHLLQFSLETREHRTYMHLFVLAQVPQHLLGVTTVLKCCLC